MTIAKRLTGLSRSTALSAPTDLPNQAGWYDFADIASVWKDASRTDPVTADGDVVLGMADKSTAGLHLVAGATGPTWKDNIQNSKAVGRFLRASSTRLYRSGDVAQPFTVYMVVKSTTGAGTYWFGGGSSFGAGLDDDSSNHPRMYAGAFLSGTTDVAGAWHVLTYVFDGASSAIYLNNVSEASGNAGTAQTGDNRWGLGSLNSGGNFASGDMGEFFAYSVVHNASDRASAVAYAKAKWATP